MKIKQDYVIKQIGKETVVVPVKDEAVRFNGIITLNNTAKFIFKSLQEESLTKEEILKRILDHFEVSLELAEKDLTNFIKTLKENNLLEEEL